jgi:hypothetical protein
MIEIDLLGVALVLALLAIMMTLRRLADAMFDVAHAIRGSRR